LNDDVKKATDKVTAAEARAKEANDQKQEIIKQKDEAKVAYDNEIAKLNEDIKKAKGEKLPAFDKLNDAYKNAIQKAGEDQQLAAKELQEKDKVVKKLESELRNLSALAKKLEEKVAPVNLLDHDQAKGEIVQLDRTGETVYINLGSGDRVNPGLTFSIYPRGVKPRHDFDPLNAVCPTCGAAHKYWNKKVPGLDRKGAIEVVEVLGPHLAKARVTGVTSGTRDPLMAGDQLYNASYNPNLREHVAVIGTIDLTGDGSDDSAEFVRNLEQQGVIVDAYLDPKDGSLKGKGLGEETNYLIVGGPNQYNDKIIELRAQAAKTGVTIVSARKFIALIGYRLPPTSASAGTYTPGYDPAARVNGLPAGR
jgi:hypothetical protein